MLILKIFNTQMTVPHKFSSWPAKQQQASGSKDSGDQSGLGEQGEREVSVNYFLLSDLSCFKVDFSRQS
eukprot:262202-Rhodomonas_salina.2